MALIHSQTRRHMIIWNIKEIFMFMIQVGVKTKFNYDLQGLLVTEIIYQSLVLLLLTFCLLLLPLWESVIVLSFVVRYFMSILVLQSSWWGRESWLLCLICLPDVSWWLSGSSSRCHGVVCGFLIVVFPDHTHLLFLNIKISSPLTCLINEYLEEKLPTYWFNLHRIGLSSGFIIFFFILHLDFVKKTSLFLT